MKHSIRTTLLAPAIAPALIGAMVSLAEPILQHDPDLETAISHLASKQSDIGDARTIAGSFPAEDVILALESRIRNDPAFALGKRARKFAFETLLQVSDYNERGIRVYTNPRQIELFVQALNDQERGVTSSILRIIHLADKRHYEQIVPAIESLFDAHSAPIMDAINTLGRIGSPAQSSLPILKRALVDPQSVNPRMTLDEETIEKYIENSIPEGWREEYRKFLEDPNSNNQWGWVTPEQSITRFRSAAALARLRIDISLLPVDITLYRTLDPLGQHAGALAILGAAIDTKGVFDGLDATSIAAAEYLSDYGSRKKSQKSLTEIIGAFSVVIHSNQTSPGVRRAWMSSLEHLVTSSNNPEFTRIAGTLLEEE